MLRASLRPAGLSVAGLFLGLAGLVPSAAAQGARSIQWSGNVREAIELAKQKRLPLLLYVPGSGGDRDNNKLENAQQRTFRNDLIVDIVSKRFVPARLPRSSDNRELFTKLGLPTDYGLTMAIATPNGERIDTLTPDAIANADAFAQKLTLGFRRFRTDLFTSDIKPVLEDENAPVPRQRAALDTIVKYDLLEADSAVIALLERRRLEEGVKQRAIDVLAHLSTKPSVKALLDMAKADKRAADALKKCTVGAAETIVEALGGEDQTLHAIAYDALVKICKIKDAKQGKFWDGKNEKVKADEIERIRKLVEKAVRTYKEKGYDDYR